MLNTILHSQRKSMAITSAHKKSISCIDQLCTIEFTYLIGVVETVVHEACDQRRFSN